MILDKFEYPSLHQQTHSSGNRKYLTPEGESLPSVTTILSQTGDKSGIEQWRERVGDAEADRVVKEAVNLGSLMHTHLECHILKEERPTGNNLVRKMAREMADIIIDRGLVDVDEFWGIERALYYPELYAGTADVIGTYKGQPAIMDFKSAKKIKKEEWVQDYYCQLAAYSLAHNELFNTKIKTGVIFMCDRNYDYKTFVVEGPKFVKACDDWHRRLDEYYS